MDYTTLIGDVTVTGSIKYAINYSRIDAAGILDEAEKWIYAKLRLFEMMAVADVAIPLDAIDAALPTRFLDPIQFSIPSYCRRLTFLDIERFRSSLAWDETGVLPVAMPTRWTRVGNMILLNTKSDAVYGSKMTFFQRPEPLSDSNQTNFLTDKYPTLLRRVCLMLAAEARKELDLMNQIEVRALSQIEEIKVENDLGMRSVELDFHWNQSE